MNAPIIQAEWDHMRRQIARQRRDISDLEKAGFDPTAAEALLTRMVDKVTAPIARRDEQTWNDRPKYPGTNKWIRGTQRRACGGHGAALSFQNPEQQSRDRVLSSAAAHGVTPTERGATRMRRLNKIWTDGDKTKLIAAVEDGASPLRAAAMLRRSLVSVKNKACECGQPFKTIYEVKRDMKAKEAAATGGL